MKKTEKTTERNKYVYTFKNEDEKFEYKRLADTFKMSIQDILSESLALFCKKHKIIIPEKPIESTKVKINKK